jgi:hypothetical protein
LHPDRRIRQNVKKLGIGLDENNRLVKNMDFPSSHTHRMEPEPPFGRWIGLIVAAISATVLGFAAEPVWADNLYIIGGGGGGSGHWHGTGAGGGASGDSARAGNGGDGAGGDGNAVGGGGGGAYVGDGGGRKGGNGGGASGATGGSAGSSGGNYINACAEAECAARAGVAGSGGKGGDASFEVSGDDSRNNVALEAGSGGGGTGHGGRGGKSTLAVGGNFSVDGLLKITSGAGGVGGIGGKGGDGGDVVLEVNGDLHAETLTIASGKGGNGGDGGNVILAVTGTLSVTTALTLESGENGAGGPGGRITLTADRLIAPTIDLTKQDGDLIVTVGTLDVMTQDVTLKLNGTTTGTPTDNTGVFFDSIDIAGERKLTVRRGKAATTFSVP